MTWEVIDALRRRRNDRPPGRQGGLRHDAGRREKADARGPSRRGLDGIPDGVAAALAETAEAKPDYSN